MKVILALLVFPISSFANASTYKLINHFQFGGKKYSNAIILESGKSGEFSEVTDSTGNGYKMNVIATPVADAKGPVKLEYTLTQLEKGKEKSVGKPTLITLLGEEAVVEMGEPNKEPDYKLTVVVEPVAAKK